MEISLYHNKENISNFYFDGLLITESHSHKKLTTGVDRASSALSNRILHQATEFQICR